MIRTIILLKLTFIFFSSYLFSQPATDVKIEFQVSSPVLNSDSSIYIAGNHADLGDWRANRIKLTYDKSGHWSKTFRFPSGTKLEYKFTRGNWRSEATDSVGQEYANFTLTAEQDTTIEYHFVSWRDLYEGATLLSKTRMQNKAGNLELLENWRYRAGDNPQWAAPSYNDSGWVPVDPVYVRFPDSTLARNGIGWFRLVVLVDSSLWNQPLAMQVYQAGASEIYLNGEPLFETGVVGTSPEEEQAYFERNPRVFRFPPQERNVFAVRFSNFSSSLYTERENASGFGIRIGEPNKYIDDRTGIVRYTTIFQMFFSVLPLTLALIHLFLFLFNRIAKENFYFAICMLGFAALSLFNFQYAFITDVNNFIWLNRLSLMVQHLAIIFGLLTVYEYVLGYVPKQFLAFLMISVAIITTYFILSNSMPKWLNNTFMVAAAIELFRVIIFPGNGRKREWLLGAGFLALFIFLSMQILIGEGIIGSVFGTYNVYVFGVLFLGVAMSVNLARRFSGMQKTIIRQEHEARDQIIAKRLLEADNSRKTRELEEARQLQLSMLPSELPKIEGLEIAVYMKTATEVGGDYYDFKQMDDETLIVAVGDATGHGTRAGIMVALIKSLFNTIGNTFFLPDFFRQCTRSIKQMKLGNLYMSMMLVRLQGKRVTASIAGMPPILIFREDTNSIEEVLIKGMPLGGVSNFPYEQRTFELNTGDVMLMMSDGFQELFNEANDLMGDERVRNSFQNAAHLPAKKLINALVKDADIWRGQSPQNDDMTFVVIRKT